MDFGQLPLAQFGLFRRERREPLPRPACAGGERARIVVRLGPVALEPDDPETAQRRGIESVAKRDERPGVACLGGADEESPRGRDVALGEGDEAFGAELARFIDRDCQRRAGSAGLLLAERGRLLAERGREFADRVLAERLRGRRGRVRRGRADENRLLDRGLYVHRRRLKTRPACDHESASKCARDEASDSFP